MRRVINVASQSLANPQGLSTLPPELYVPLWWYSGSRAGMSSGTEAQNFVAKGQATAGLSGNSSINLLTTSTNWSTKTKCALEVSCYTTSGSVATAELWDVTSNAAVPNSQISIPATGTMTVIRSNQFTLNPSHQYTITMWGSSGSYLTDASLIIFPNQQLLAQGSLANITLGRVGQYLAESQIPLWVYSSGAVSTTTVSPYVFLQKGSTSTNTSNTASSTQLHTLNSKWSPSQKFAFEASFYTSVASTGFVSLWDMTSNAQVISISTSSTTATLIRSGSFTLTPGHVYGVGMEAPSGGTIYLTKSYLIPLFS